MKCPHCITDLHGNIELYGVFVQSYPGTEVEDTEYRCRCPHCGKEFKWFITKRR